MSKLKDAIVNGLARDAAEQLQRATGDIGVIFVRLKQGGQLDVGIACENGMRGEPLMDLAGVLHDRIEQVTGIHDFEIRAAKERT